MYLEHGWTGQAKPRLECYRGFENAAVCLESMWSKFMLSKPDEARRFKDRCLYEMH